jgi:RimJ/RimL family protein N-acetyltransferase
MRALNKPPISTVDEARAMVDDAIRDWRAEGLGPFVLETATDAQVVGQAGLMIFDARDWTASTWADAGAHAQPELGWALIRAHWGRGYATEAAAAIRDWAYESRAVDRLVSLISPDNVRSRRVAERLGAVAAEVVTPADSGLRTVVWRHPRPTSTARRGHSAGELPVDEESGQAADAGSAGVGRYGDSVSTRRRNRGRRPLR